MYTAECQTVTLLSDREQNIHTAECQTVSRMSTALGNVQNVCCCVSDTFKFLSRKIFVLMNFSTHLKYKQLPNHFAYQQLTVTRLTL
jgi:hypothetical protein